MRNIKFLLPILILALLSENVYSQECDDPTETGGHWWAILDYSLTVPETVSRRYNCTLLRTGYTFTNKITNVNFSADEHILFTVQTYHSGEKYINECPSYRSENERVSPQSYTYTGTFGSDNGYAFYTSSYPYRNRYVYTKIFDEDGNEIGISYYLHEYGSREFNYEGRPQIVAVKALSREKLTKSIRAMINLNSRRVLAVKAIWKEGEEPWGDDDYQNVGDCDCYNYEAQCSRLVPCSNGDLLCYEFYSCTKNSCGEDPNNPNPCRTRPTISIKN